MSLSWKRQAYFLHYHVTKLRIDRHQRLDFFVIVIGLILIIGLMFWQTAFAATFIAKPTSDISSAWPTCSGGCPAMMQYSFVDEAVTANTSDWISTGTNGAGGEVVEFGLDSPPSVQTATQVVVHANLRSATLGDLADTVGIGLRINGTLQPVTTVTMTTSFTDYTATFSGTWSQADVDSMQIYLIRNVQGGGSPSARDDDVQLANTYADITYAPAVTFDQSAYRWFDNQDAVGNSYVKTVGGGGDHYAKSVDKTDDGGFVVTGGHASLDNTGTNMFIAKYDSSHNISWHKTFDISSGADIGQSVVQTSDGGYAVTGNANSFGATSVDMFIAKYDSSGILQWSHLWGGSGSTADHGTGVAETTAGNLVVTGYTNSFGAGSYDMFLVQYSSSGVFDWSRTLGSAGIDDGRAITATTDGGVAVAGSFAEDAIIAKFDANGVTEWSSYFGGPLTDSFDAIIQTSDGNYAVAGSGDVYTDEHAAIVAKYDSSGTLTWDHYWQGGTDSYWTVGTGIAETYNDNDQLGNLAVLGHTSEPSTSNGGFDIFMVEFDPSGAQVTIPHTQSWGGSSEDNSGGITRLNDGTLVLVGDTSSYGSGYMDNVIAHTNLDGFLEGCVSPMCKTQISPQGMGTSFNGGTPSLTVRADGVGYTSTRSTPSPVTDTHNVAETLVISSPVEVSTPRASTNTAATTPGDGVPFRLRMNLHVNTAQAEADSAVFKLQVAARVGTCQADSSADEMYSNVTSYSGDIRYFDNTNAEDGAPLTSNVNDPIHGSDGLVRQSYQEVNDFTINNAIPVGQDGMWDFVLVTQDAPVNTSYCFRAVSSTGDLLASYGVVPEIATPIPAMEQSSYRFYQNSDSATPGAPLAAQNTTATVATGTPFRLRQLINQTAGVTPAGSGYKLQAGEKTTTCSAASYSDIGQGGSTGYQQTAGTITSGTSGGYTWSFPERAATDDQNYASAMAPYNTSKAQFTTDLKATNFGFNIPTEATITGIAVSYQTFDSPYAQESEVYIVKGGTIMTAVNHSDDAMQSPSSTTNSHGSSSDMWGQSWTPADVNSSGFGFSVKLQLGPAIVTEDFFGRVDYMAVNVYYTMPAALQFHDNLSITDNAGLTTHANDPIGSNIVAQTYNENAIFTNVATLSTDDSGLWDFAMVADASLEGKTYCLRVVESDGTPLAAYSHYPEITFGAGGGQASPTLDQQMRGGRAIIDGQETPFSW